MANVVSNFQDELQIRTGREAVPSDESRYVQVWDVMLWSSAASELLLDFDYDFIKEAASSSRHIVYDSGNEISFSGIEYILSTDIGLRKFEWYIAELDLRVTLDGFITLEGDSQTMSGRWTQMSLSRSSAKTTVYGGNDYNLSDGSIIATRITFTDSTSRLEYGGDWSIEFDFSLENTNYSEVGTVSSITYEQGYYLQNITAISYDWNMFNNRHDNQIEALLQEDDYISGSLGDDVLFGYEGDDVFVGHIGDDVFYGANGLDTVEIAKSSNNVSEFRHLKTGGVVITSDEGIDVLHDIEYVKFLDASFSIQELIVSRKAAYTFQGGDGETSLVSSSIYSGPVSYLEYELIGKEVDEVYYGSSNNDFLSLKGGDDAADGGLGDDVLDGGTGSNFLIGGGGNDTFFLDGRGGSVTWSTVTDFSADEVNIWGWVDGVSTLLATDPYAGADGFKGATFHYDLNNDGEIDTSITFSGLSIDQVPNSQALIVEGNGYLLIV